MLLPALSVDCWAQVFSQLDAANQLVCSLVCKSWFALLKVAYRFVTAWRVVIRESCHLSDCQFVPTGDGTFWANVHLCVCDAHGDLQLSVLEALLEAAGPYALHLSVEDETVSAKSSVDGRILQLLFERCCKLDSLQLYNVNLSRVELCNLLPVGLMRKLNMLLVDDCYPNLLINDKLLSVVADIETITEIHLRHCDALTDRSMKWFSEKCPYLSNVDVTGCKALTAVGLACLVVSLPSKVHDLVHVKVSELAVDGEQLKALSLLHDDDWVFISFQIALGRSACCIYRRTVPHKSVVIYV
ncbi:F-box domain protein [Trichuris suis]|nr:F-box domain protein [Trichuris suis]